MKHNKKRNTAFLYETLIRELTKAVLDENETRKELITSMLKEHFGKGTLLHDELKQYKALYEVENLDKTTAERLVAITVSEHDKLNKKSLFVEQSKLISRINRELSSETLQTFVPNYKSLATIYQLFNTKEGPKGKVLLEGKIVSEITKKEEKEILQPIDNLVLKSFTRNFNEEYEKGLLKEQQELLGKYIVSISDNGSEFKLYLNEEIERIKDIITSSRDLEDVKSDKLMLEKTDEVLTLIEGFKGSQINQEMLIQIMKMQKLVEEIKS